MCDDPDFDAYADQYGKALNLGISVSGEGRDFFARGRLVWLRRCLDQLGAHPVRVMDFGCGTGGATPFLFDVLGCRSVIGVDTSERSLAIAREVHGGERARFALMKDSQPDGSLDLAFCNGVFHHIPLDQRHAAIAFIYRFLQPGGLFAFWENNPWNPGTQIVMARIPFDRNAIKVPPPEARRLAREGGFGVLGTTYQFIFPRALRFLRGLEFRLATLPLGAQYQVLARKPER